MIESSKTILVVDTDPHILKLVGDYLEAKLSKVLRATNSTIALDLARQYHPDLIISDITLIPTDGFELLKEVRADPSISVTPFMICTARNEPADYSAAMLFGADGYVEKPFELKVLLIKIMNVFDKPDLIEPSSRTEMSTDIFITSMKIVRDYLTNSGLSISCWDVSQLDDPNRRQLTIHAIKRCWCVVPVLPLTFWEYYELEVASILGKTVFPVLIEGELDSKEGMLEPYYRSVWDARKDYDEVLSRLVNKINQYLYWIKA
ncbi:MAG: response regulator [Anaerolineae bacterium]|nr:response regulator [Anaerolineae bacterium]